MKHLSMVTQSTHVTQWFRRIVQAVLLPVLFLPSLAWTAGPFRILNDPINNSSSPADIELCKAFLDNLNSFPAWPPMVCERKLSPNFPQFSRPKWRRWSNEEILRRQRLMRELWPKSSLITLEQLPQLLEKEPDAIRIDEAEPVEWTGWERTPGGGSRPKTVVEHWIKVDFSPMSRVATTGDFRNDLQRCGSPTFYLVDERGESLADVAASGRFGDADDILLYTAPDGKKRRLFEGFNVVDGFLRAIYTIDGICSIEYHRPTKNKGEGK